MSLSTLTQWSPRVCRRTHGSVEDQPRGPRRIIDWAAVAHATLAAASATTLAQLVATPLDVGTRASNAAGATSNVASALARIVRVKGAGAVFTGLPLNLLKRSPTKALTVALFEVGTQALLARTAKGERRPLSPIQHLSIAISSGALAMIATYPIHLSYYALRKGLTFSNIVRCARLRPQIVYSGAIPALVSTAPAVMVDYAMYKHLRKQISGGIPDQGRVPHALQTAAVVFAAAASNLAGGFMSEPFKALSRRMAVDSVRYASCGSMAVTARSMMQLGPGEFWRGFRVRSLRYALSAVVSKTTVEQLKRTRPDTRPPSFGSIASLQVTLGGKSLKAGLRRYEQKAAFSNARASTTYRIS